MECQSMRFKVFECANAPVEPKVMVHEQQGLDAETLSKLDAWLKKPPSKALEN